MTQPDAVIKIRREFPIVPSSFVYNQFRFNGESKEITQERFAWYRELFMDIFEFGYKIW